MTAVDDRSSASEGVVALGRSGNNGSLVVAEQDIRDLWVSGRALILVLFYSILLSCVTYLAAVNQVLNFLEQREALNLILQLAMAVGVLVTMVVSADAISGERERGTWEILLLTPVSRRGIVAGKLAGALTLWIAAWLVSVPYIWVLGHGVGLVGEALLVNLLVGTMLALAMASFGILVSALSNSNKVSISVSLFALVVLSAPTQLPTGLANTWIGGALIRLNPIGSALHYVSSVLVRRHGWTQDLSYLAAPLLTAVLCGGVLLIAGTRIVRLAAGSSGR
jgi:ABC-2 type transport system permease protein